jgi:hypothetical protein
MSTNVFDIHSDCEEWLTLLSVTEILLYIYLKILFFYYDYNEWESTKF